MQSLLQDLRYSARILLKKPGSTLVIILTLALGIGANTAIFTVVNAVLLRPAPFVEPDRIAVLATTMRRDRVEVRSTSYPDFADWRDQNTVFERVAARSSNSFNLVGDAGPENVSGELVSAGYFPLLGARAALGRTFLPEEDRAPDAHRVAMVGFGLWQRRFGGDPGLVGRTIHLSDGGYTVVGIMPEGFRGVSDQAEIWLPVMMVSSVRYAGILKDRDQRWLSTVARLKPGVTTAQAQAEMDAIMSRLERAYPDSNGNRGARVTPLPEQFFGQMRLMLWILFGAVSCVLLVACANVANLQLQRAAGRASEMAVRQALGATRRRLVRQLLTESLMLAFAGGALGVLLAMWGVEFLVKFSPVSFPSFVKPTVDVRALGFSLLASIGAGTLFGLAPALQAAKTSLGETLKTGGRGASGGLGRNRLLGSLVVSEMAIALTLLVGAGLMVRSLQRLQAVDPGFDSGRLLTMRFSLPEKRYRKDQMLAFAQQMRERMRPLPGAQSVALASDLPLSGNTSAGPIEIEGRPASPADGEIRIFRHRVMPGFFSTLGIPLLKGRDFTDGDHAQATRVIVVSESLARRYWPNEDPIGKRIKESDPGDPWLTVVGVVGEVKYRGIPQNPTADPDVYFSLPQYPSGNLSLAIRASGDPNALIAPARRVLQSLDPDLPAYGVVTMEEQVARQTTQSRFSAWLLGVFGVFALALAAVGIYSVMSYAVAQRSREIGIRMAMGARGADVMKMVLGQGMKLALSGVALGLGAALSLTQLMKKLLFGVTAADPLTYVVIALLLAAIALLACYLPARRATKVHPLVALRYE
jgi:putative ABC transport system permease protein